MRQYPRWFLPALLALLSTVLLTGLGLTPTTLALRAEWDLPWRLAGTDRVWIAALHSGLAFGLAAVVGALWSVHMRSGWRRRRQRLSGALLGSALAVLAASAVGVYYLGDDRLAAAAAYVHLGVGLFASVLFVWHWRRGRAAARRERSGRSERSHGRHHPIDPRMP